MCHEPGDVYERIHSHQFVVFYTARFIRGDLPRESHAGYTQGWGAYVIEVSRKSIQH